MDIASRLIKNAEVLAVTPARSSVLAIAEAGIRSILTPEVIRRSVSCTDRILTVCGTSYNLEEYKHLYILGVGKCAIDAGIALEHMLGDVITDGVVIDVRPPESLTRIRGLQGTHPFPSTHNITHTRTLLDLAERADAHDLVIAIISGGGSALLCQPKTHTATEEATLIEHLFKSGATIGDLNIVRKHLSYARGGHLAVATSPAKVISLLFSDVPGDDRATIASGPTILDTSTVADAIAICTKHGVERSGFSLSHFFETPKDVGIFERVTNELVLTNTTALEAMQSRAQELGYTAYIRDTKLEGEARDVGVMVASELHVTKPRTVLLYGGETTVTVSGPGKGGRNEELSLGALPLLTENELVLSVASDGRDNTDFAGGIADAHTRVLADEVGIDSSQYLYTNDSYAFFHTLQQGVQVGYTGSNVADLIIGMKHDEIV